MAYTTINKPSDYFRTKTYTGNATNDTAITWDETDNMKPDWLWFKNRSQAQSHALFDSTRGATLRLISNSFGAEGTENTNLDSFDTNGFTVDYEAIVNGSGDNMVAWGWKANGGTTSSNTDGSITSTVQADTTSGFSIVSYTGTGTQPSTVGHGLGVIPKMLIVKPRTDAQSWCVYHESSGANNVIYLDSTSAQGGSSVWNSTSPTSSVFTVNDNQVNSSGITYIAYCFAEVKGFSKFGSYVGNGSTDGTFVYTGFKPAFVITKRTDSASDWVMLDNKRDSFNLMNKKLFPDNSDSEYSGQNACDFLSNGFKLRDNATNNFATNISGGTYIYMAFAEEPLVGDNPCTAR